MTYLVLAVDARREGRVLALAIDDRLSSDRRRARTFFGRSEAVKALARAIHHRPKLRPGPWFYLLVPDRGGEWPTAVGADELRAEIGRFYPGREGVTC